MTAGMREPARNDESSFLVPFAARTSTFSVISMTGTSSSKSDEQSADGLALMVARDRLAQERRDRQNHQLPPGQRVDRDRIGEDHFLEGRLGDQVVRGAGQHAVDAGGVDF